MYIQSRLELCWGGELLKAFYPIAVLLVYYTCVNQLLTKTTQRGRLQDEHMVAKECSLVLRVDLVSFRRSLPDFILVIVPKCTSVGPRLEWIGQEGGTCSRPSALKTTAENSHLQPTLCQF